MVKRLLFRYAGLLPLAMPLVSAQERTGSINLYVERIGNMAPLSLSSVMVIIILLLALLILLAYLSALLWKRHHQRRLPKVKAHIETKVYQEQEPATYAMEHILIEDEVEKHLKEDERIIVRLLRQREGRCEQGTLCLVSGFSKATLSRLLTELEERGILRKERQGKKNMVYIRI